MKMRIVFDMDNAAFEDNPDAEVDGILSDIALQYSAHMSSGNIVMDTNGNRIGQWTIEE